jgi:hypothetical protein
MTLNGTRRLPVFREIHRYPVGSLSFTWSFKTNVYAFGVPKIP